jgi:hypothetical protein
VWTATAFLGAPASGRLWWGRRPCRPCHLATPPHRLAGEDAGASRGKPWPSRHLTLLLAPVEPASGGTVQRVALAGATTAPGYQGTYDLTVTGRGPPVDRWSRPWRRGRPRCEPAGGNGGCPGRPGGCRYPTLNPAWRYCRGLTTPAASAGPPSTPARWQCCPPQARPSRAHRPPGAGGLWPRRWGHPRAPAREEHGLATTIAPHPPVQRGWALAVRAGLASPGPRGWGA